MHTLVIHPIGNPAPQGSKRIGRQGDRPVIIDDNPARLNLWRHTIETAARITATRNNWTHHDEPLAVHIHFRLQPPKRRTAHTRNEPAVRPDIDKLARAVLDALTHAGTITDDARVTLLTSQKTWTAPGEPPGATITITTRNNP